MSEPALSESPELTPSSLVTLRGLGSQLVVELDSQAPFERLRDEVRRLFGETPGRFKGTTARLAFGARDLSLFDLRRLVHLLGAQPVGHGTPAGLHQVPAPAGFRGHLLEDRAEHLEDHPEEGDAGEDGDELADVGPAAERADEERTEGGDGDRQERERVLGHGAPPSRALAARRAVSLVKDESMPK